MLKQILIIFLTALIAVSQAQAQQAGLGANIVKVPYETPLRFATMEALNSATAKKGDDVPLCLVTALVVNGVTLLPEGTVVHGRVTRVKQPKANCRNAEVEWKLYSIPFADGTYARSQVGFVSPDAGAELPKYMPAENGLGPAFWIFAFPFILAVTAPFIVLLLPYYAAVQLDHRCPGEGHDYVLPANATVGVVIRKEHRVRY